MAQDLFNTLPPELRNRIYDLVVLSPIQGGEIQLRLIDGTFRPSWESPGGLQRTIRPPTPMPGILSTSATIRREALPIYYHITKHVLCASVDEIQTASAWLAKSIRAYGGLPEHFTLKLYNVSWSNFQDIFPLVEVARDPGLDPAPLTLGLWGRAGVRLLGVMIEAIQLGRRAHDTGTEASELRQDFDQWVAEVRKRPYVQQ